MCFSLFGKTPFDPIDLFLKGMHCLKYTLWVSETYHPPQILHSHRRLGIPDFRIPGFPDFRIARFPDFPISRLLISRFPRFHDFPISGFPHIRFREFLISATSRFSLFRDFPPVGVPFWPILADDKKIHQYLKMCASTSRIPR